MSRFRGQSSYELGPWSRRSTAGLAIWVAIAAAGCQQAADAEAQAETAAAPSDPLADRWAELNDPERQRREPFKIFDNLYYVGIGWVSAYLLVTSDGLVLIDSLYGEFVDQALAGIRQLGFDPADLRYLLVTHGHFDHGAGAKRIQDETGARVGMTAADWELLATDPGDERVRFEVPASDLVIADGDVLVLGDTKIELYVTPGHTPGVLSLGFSVRDGANTYRAFCFGGVGLNFSGVERTVSYLASVARLKEMGGIEVNITNHPGMGKIFERAEQIAQRAPGAPHPFVAADDWRAWLDELTTSASAKLAEERQQEAAAPSTH